MGKGTTSQRVMPIIIPRLDDPAAASVDERDEHLMLLEAARHHLDIEWTETLAAAETAGDHEVMGYRPRRPTATPERRHNVAPTRWATSPGGSSKERGLRSWAANAPI